MFCLSGISVYIMAGNDLNDAGAQHGYEVFAPPVTDAYNACTIA